MKFVKRFDFVNRSSRHSNRITLPVSDIDGGNIAECSLDGVLVGTYKKVCVDEETLYRRADGRPLVYVIRRCDNDPPVLTLVWWAQEADLQPGGQFEKLGRACGITSPQDKKR